MSFLSKIFKEGKVLQGKATKDKTYFSEHRYPDIATAKGAYEWAKKKLMDVNGWSEMPGLTSKFELYDKFGQRVQDRGIKTGDYIKIILPGPAPQNWVKVTNISAKDHSSEFVVNPSENPQKGGHEVEHFFIKEATSTFKVELKGTTLYAYEIGRNEGINNQGMEAGDRELVNTLVAEGGWAAFQKIQWKNLTDFLVHKSD